MKINFNWKKDGNHIDNLMINNIEVGYIEYSEYHNEYIAWRNIRAGTFPVFGHNLPTKKLAKKYLIDDITKFINELIGGIKV